MTLLAVETVSCVSLYGATIDCAQEDCGGPPYIPGNARATDGGTPSNDLDAADDAPSPGDAATSDAESTSDSGAARDASGD